MPQLHVKAVTEGQEKEVEEGWGSWQERSKGTVNLLLLAGI